MELVVEGEIVHWRGPAPHHFVPVVDDDAAAIGEVAAGLTYGWGVVPVTVELGATRWTTSLFPRDGGYLVPLRAAARRAEGVGIGDVVRLVLRFEL